MAPGEEIAESKCLCLNFVLFVMSRDVFRRIGSKRGFLCGEPVSCALVIALNGPDGRLLRQ
jgi:hypothetical protein